MEILLKLDETNIKLTNTQLWNYWLLKHTNRYLEIVCRDSEALCLESSETLDYLDFSVNEEKMVEDK